MRDLLVIFMQQHSGARDAPFMTQSRVIMSVFWSATSGLLPTSFRLPSIFRGQTPQTEENAKRPSSSPAET
jgi:hypothetical protein